MPIEMNVNYNLVKHNIGHSNKENQLGGQQQWSHQGESNHFNQRVKQHHRFQRALTPTQQIRNGIRDGMNERMQRPFYIRKNDVIDLEFRHLNHMKEIPEQLQNKENLGMLRPTQSTVALPLT